MPCAVWRMCKLRLAFCGLFAVYWKTNGDGVMTIAYTDIVLLNAELRGRGLCFSLAPCG